MNSVVGELKHLHWVSVCKVDDLIIDCGACVLVDQQQIAIFQLSTNDEVYALSNYDPLSDVNVLSRGLVGDIKGEPVVASPIYKHRFSLVTGQCIDDSDTCIPVFRTKVLEEDVYIALE